MSTGSQEYIPDDSLYQQGAQTQRRQQLGVLLLLAGLLMLFRPHVSLINPLNWLAQLPFFAPGIPARLVAPVEPMHPGLHSEPHEHFGLLERAHPRDKYAPQPAQPFGIPDGAYSGAQPLPLPPLEQRWEYRWEQPR